MQRKQSTDSARHRDGIPPLSRHSRYWQVQKSRQVGVGLEQSNASGASEDSLVSVDSPGSVTPVDRARGSPELLFSSAAQPDATAINPIARPIANNHLFATTPFVDMRFPVSI